MHFINLFIDLTLFPYLRYKYNFIKEISLKIATKTLVYVLHFLSA